MSLRYVCVCVCMFELLCRYVQAGHRSVQLAQHLCLFWVFNPSQVLEQSVISTQTAVRHALAAHFQQAAADCRKG